MLSDEAWAAIEPLIPMDRRGVKPRRNRQVIGGIVFVLRSGCPWAACPAEYAPAKTVYNRFARWSRDGVWQRMADASVRLDAVDVQSVDSTSVKAHRCAAGGKGGPSGRRSGAAGAGGRPRSTPSPTSISRSPTCCAP